MEAVAALKDRISFVVFFAALHRHSAVDLQPNPKALPDIRQAFDVPAAIGEHELKPPLGVLLFTLTDGVHDNGGKRNVSFACLRFGRPDDVPCVSPLPYVNDAGI